MLQVYGGLLPSSGSHSQLVAKEDMNTFTVDVLVLLAKYHFLQLLFTDNSFMVSLVV